eukprot:TRINITY_DN5117_c0_g1_i1.p1 TRINITY_DN5117_c0_g1~~TRINITY_DN5117_c0_g1_i1.p1  ORF type:complete len:547 (-),score=92.87 TRINITY_DN5117_c0_g1_i1:1190-2830(-)
MAAASLLMLLAVFAYVSSLVSCDTAFEDPKVHPIEDFTKSRHRNSEVASSTTYYSAPPLSDDAAERKRTALEEAFGIPLGVFVCVTGQRGRLELLSKRHHLLRPLRRFFHTVDVAFVLSSGGTFANTGHGAENSRQTPQYNLTRAVADIATGVAEHDFVPPADPVLNENYMARLDKSKASWPRRARSHVAQWTMYVWCYDLMQQMEARRGRPYTHAMRLRDDSFFPWPINPAALAEAVAPKTAKLPESGWQTVAGWPLESGNGGAPMIGFSPSAQLVNTPATTRFALGGVGKALADTLAARDKDSEASRGRHAMTHDRVPAPVPSTGSLAARAADVPFVRIEGRWSAPAADVRIAEMLRLANASADRHRARRGGTASGAASPHEDALHDMNVFNHHVTSPRCEDGFGMNDKATLLVRPAALSFFVSPLIDKYVYFNDFHDVRTPIGYLNAEQMLYRSVVRRGIRVARVAARLLAPLSSRYFGNGRWCVKMWFVPQGLPCYAEGNAVRTRTLRYFSCPHNPLAVHTDSVTRFFQIPPEVPDGSLLTP